MTGIFTGLNIVEIGSASVAASVTGMVFADAGARVLKIEAPEGDGLRRTNPSGFLVWNRGKESLALDLRTADGQRRLRGLATAADVVIDAFAPGTTSAWGIDAAALTGLNPALVHCGITGFGKTGPYAGLKAYDTLVAAKAGLWARGGWAYREGPIMYPVPWASFGAAMESIAGIVGALLVREKTGRGQAIDATLYAGLEPVDYMVSIMLQLMAKRGEQVDTNTRGSQEANRYGVLVATRDGRLIQTSTMLPHQARALCEVAGVAGKLELPQFARAPMFDSAEIAQEFEDLLVDAFLTEDLAHWLPLLLDSPNIAFEVAATSEQSLDHPQIVHNGDVITIEDPAVGPVRQVGPIAHFEKTPLIPARSAPALDQHQGDLVAGPRQAGTGEDPPHPFSGVTVVEFGYFYAMPYGVKLLASLGARVIKIEDAAGDPHRRSFGPEVASTKTTAGKESVSVDLSTPEGRRFAQRIVAAADVLAVGFRSGIADKLGLGYEELRALNPRLVYLHAAGYGTDGPYASRALYAQAAQAVGGSFGRQVGYWADPELNRGMSRIELQAVVFPRLNQVIDGDANAALGVLAALALAIYHQQRTGEGQRVRTSMIASNALAYSDDFCAYRGKPPVPLCDDEFYGTSAVNRFYEAAEGGWVCLTVQSDAEFGRLASALGDDGLRAERFATDDGRRLNDAALVDALDKRFRERPAADWEAALAPLRVGCVAVNMTGLAAFTSFDPVLQETGLTTRYDHPLFGEMVAVAPPLAFSATPGRAGVPSLRGQHNRAILAETGYSAEEAAELEARKVVIPPTTSA